MTAETSAAVAEPETGVEPKRKPDSGKPKLLPPHAVVVLNDDVHTFEYVLEVFAKVFGYPPEKCFKLAEHIHIHGRGIVWSGPKEVAELKRDQIRSVGPDLYAARKVEGPLGVVIEPLPG